MLSRGHIAESVRDAFLGTLRLLMEEFSRKEWVQEEGTWDRSSGI